MTQTPERNLKIALLDRVVARVKAAADELAQLRIELRNAGGDLVANGPGRFIVPDGKGGSIEVVVDETGDTVAAIKSNDKLVGMLARALWTGERSTTVNRKVAADLSGPPLHVFVTADPATMARCILEGVEQPEGEAVKAEVAKALDDYHAPSLLLAAVKCERAAMLDQARAGEWIERSERLRELARAASAIACARSPIGC